MSGNLNSPSAVTRPLKSFGKLLTRLLRGAESRPPENLPLPLPLPQALNDGSGSESESEKRLSFMLESVPVNLWSTDARLNITFSQGAGLHLIGTSGKEQVGMTLYEVLKTRDPGFTPLAAHLRALQGELVRYEVEWRGRSFETRVEPLRSADGHISGTVGIAIDITDRKALEEELRALLLVDELTGLNNRRAFIALSEQALKQAARNGHDVLMIFIDVDHLKYINDTWGHLAGDRALIDAAGVLRESCREADIFARLGGDEFVALMTVDSDQTAEIISARIQARVDLHNSQTERGYSLSLSVGATWSKAAGTLLADLLAQADTALYDQKRGRVRPHALSR
jgi:diguanylate cyclase (GGDEF)-like protein/PAS domain S-box-containing protein